MVWNIVLFFYEKIESQRNRARMARCLEAIEQGHDRNDIPYFFVTSEVRNVDYDLKFIFTILCPDKLNVLESTFIFYANHLEGGDHAFPIVPSIVPER